jgi:type I restriction enzyme, S subunit
VSLVHQLLTEHIDVWTAADTGQRSARGRASNIGKVYGITKLRALILELAVRGKLVPQDPSDEPSGELLKRIHMRKNEDRKIAGKRRQSLDKLQIKMEVPVGWSVVRFDEIFALEYGDNLPAEKRTNSGEYPVYGSNGIVGTHNVAFLTSPCIVVGRKGSAGALNLCQAAGCCVTDVAYYCVPPAEVDLSYSFKLFHTLGLDVLGKGIKPGLSRSEVYVLPVAIPPLAEQRRIVAKVDELMVLCDQLESEYTDSSDAHQKLVECLLGTLTQSQSRESLNANWQRVAVHFDSLFTTEYSIEKLKQTILQLAVMGKLVTQDPGDEPVNELLKRIIEERDRKIDFEGSRTSASDAINDSEIYMSIPDGWKYCRLGNLARFIDYRGKTPNKVDSGIPLITAKNVRFGFISREPEEFISKEEYVSWMTRGFPRPGDLLFTTEAPLGNVALIDIAEEFALAQRVICLQLHEQAIGDFVKIAIMSNQVQQQLILSATGMTATGIKASKLKEILIPIPPLQEQHRIVGKVNELLMLCEELKFRIAEANGLQKNIADVFVSATTGVSLNIKSDFYSDLDAMKIKTTLELVENIDPAVAAPLAKIVEFFGGVADAKDVWKKSKLALPDFYKQLKNEIESGFIRRPQSASYCA